MSKTTRKGDILSMTLLEAFLGAIIFLLFLASIGIPFALFITGCADLMDREIKKFCMKFVGIILIVTLDLYIFANYGCVR